MPSLLPIWRRPRAQLFALLGLVWALILTVLWIAWPVLLPFLLATLSAYVIDPAIVWLCHHDLKGRRLNRAGAVLLVYVLIAGFGWLLSISIIPQVYREAMRGLTELRDFLASLSPERLGEWARAIDGFFQRYGIPLDVLPGSGSGNGRLSVDLAQAIADALHQASMALRVLFMLTAFISMDAPRILRFLESLVPSEWREDARRLLHGIDTGLAGVLRGQLTIMAMNGLLTFLGLVVLRIPFAFALSALATLLYVVPIFGTIISTVPVVLLALGAGGASTALFALGWILVIHSLETYVFNPKIMGHASKIHPVLIVLALVVGERTWGILGALLAVPMASVFVAVFRFLHKKVDELDQRARPVGPAVTLDAGSAASLPKGPK
jgi:predicted PurR-regulated permease PerM